MEVLRWRGAVRHADVALGAEREEALEPGAGVLGSLTFVPVRQEQREPRRLAPFGEAGNQELIDHDFGAVGEVPELRLPQYQRVLGLDRVPVLEAETRVLRERAVVELERRLAVRQRLHRR